MLAVVQQCRTGFQPVTVEEGHYSLGQMASDVGLTIPHLCVIPLLSP